MPDGDDSSSAHPQLAFLQQFESLIISRGDGKVEVDSDNLIALIDAHREEAVVLCRAYLETAKTRESTWHAFAQQAVLIAAVLQNLTNDDSMAVWVQRELDVAGINVTAPQVISGGEAPAFPTPSRIDVDATMLEIDDVYPFVSLFGLRSAGPDGDLVDRFRSMRHRLTISFGIPLTDPREVWEVPSVRAYVSHLQRAFPHLPYFFSPDPAHGMLQIWLYCLSPLDEFVNGQLNLRGDGALAGLAVILHGIRATCEALGEKTTAPWMPLFANIPDEVIAEALAVAGSREMSA